MTPFRNGELDETSLRRLVRHYAAGPVDGLILAATSGEGMSLDMSELEQLVAIVQPRDRDQPAHIPICLGLSGASTHKMCDALDETAAWPIDGYLIASPYYIAAVAARPAAAFLRRSPITRPGRSRSTTFPIAAPSASRTTRCLRLAQHPNIIGLKDCCADRAQSIDLLRRRPAGFRVLTGEDAQYHNALIDGADGAILLSAHVETEAFAAVRTAAVGGQPGSAPPRSGRQIAELTRLLFVEPSPAPAKYWLARIGLIDSAEVRLPMVEVGAELAARLDAEIARRTPPLQRRA